MPNWTRGSIALPPHCSATAFSLAMRLRLCATASVDYTVAFLGGLRAGAVVAPLAPSSSAASLVSMIGNSGARLLFLDADVKRLLEPVAARDQAQSPIALDAHAGSTSLNAWLAPGGSHAATREDRSRVAVQHHLFVRHDGHAEGHRAIARHALGVRGAQHSARLRTRRHDADLDTAVFEHDAREFHADADVRRHRRVDAEVRRDALSRTRAAIPRDAHDAGACAISASDGASRISTATTSPVFRRSSAPARRSRRASRRTWCAAGPAVSPSTTG